MDVVCPSNFHEINSYLSYLTMAFKFEELKIWQISLSLSDEIDTTAKQFPKTELFSLTTQIKKAADSVNLNIAEGCMGQSKAEFLGS